MKYTSILIIIFLFSNCQDFNKTQYLQLAHGLHLSDADTGNISDERKTNFADHAQDHSGGEQILEIDGRNRIYYLHLPLHLKKNAPLVFVLHGYGGNAKSMIDFSEMNKVADKNGFAVCYPQGYLGQDDKNSWNAGYSNFEVDDVKFISTLAKYLQTTHQLSKKYTFCTGMSNGADMSYVLACQKPELFIAVAPVAGCMMQATFDNCNQVNPVSIFEIHGTADKITLWEGDKSYLPGSGGYISVPATFKYWVQKNGSGHIQIDTLIDRDTGDGSFVIREKHSFGKDNHRTWLYTLAGGGHDWPGTWGNNDFEASEEIWNFFRQSIEDQDIRRNLVFFGSSVCRGSGATKDAGYARQLYQSGSIDTLTYKYHNASTGGDNTLKVEQQDRLAKKLYPTDPDIVVIGLSLGNESIRNPHTDEGRSTIVEQFRSRLLALADSLHSLGVAPVIANCYPHSYFHEPQYQSTKDINQIINTWDYPSINLLGAIDDGEGRWVEGFVKDPSHPNTEGHHEMYLAIVPSLFDAILEGKKSPRYDWNKSFTKIENLQKVNAITYDVVHTIHSFAVSLRFKNAASGVLVHLETDQGSRQVVINDYNISYEDLSTTFPKHTGTWNHVVISHNYANQKTIFAINGKIVGTKIERLIPKQFVYGGNLDSVALKDLTLHRSSLHEDEISDLNNKLFIQSSLEIYSPLTQSFKSPVIPNKAQSLSNLKVHPDVKLEWIEQPHY